MTCSFRKPSPPTDGGKGKETTIAGQTSLLHEILERIFDAWRDVQSLALHPPSCSCRGSHPMVMQRDAIEQDITAYLRRKYQSGDRPQLLKALKTRAADPEMGFIDWLNQSCQQIDVDEAEILCTEVLRLLRNMAGKAVR